MGLEYLQESFLGGINQQVDPTRISKNEYMLGINVRNREDVLEPIYGPKDLSGFIPVGKIQGLYSSRSLSILFISGEAFFKDFTKGTSTTGWTKIKNFRMNDQVDTIWAEFVPASSINYARAQYPGEKTEAYGGNPIDNSQENSIAYYPVTSAASPAAIVVQDGKSQPWVIDVTGNARVTQDYSQWSAPDKREYVPIGKQMLYSDGILYIEAPDGSRTFRSVTGRPLDFVIAVTGNTGVRAGNADATAIAWDYNTLTCLTRISIGQSGFMGSSLSASYIITPIPPETVDNAPFNEPIYSFQFAFPGGPVNQFSTADLGGDLGLITDSGIRSFNGTSALRTESNYDPFSSKVYRLFSKSAQTQTCACNFDNYALFAINTIYGSGILVYDTLSQGWSSLDLYEGVGQIKQFAVVQYGNVKRLLFYDENNKFYEAFASTTLAGPKLYIGEFTSGNPKVEQKALKLNLAFIDAETAGTVTARLYVDRKKNKKHTETLKKTKMAQTFPITDIPFGEASEKDDVQILTFDDSFSSETGFKLGYFVEWDCKSSLSHIRVESQPKDNRGMSVDQSVRSFTAAHKAPSHD